MRKNFPPLCFGIEVCVLCLVHDCPRSLNRRTRVAGEKFGGKKKQAPALSICLYSELLEIVSGKIAETDEQPENRRNNLAEMRETKVRFPKKR